MSEATAPTTAPSAEDRAPRHVAIIMDGNGRWAAARGLPRTEGHRRGVEALRKTVRAAGELGIQILTIFSFSSENWLRPVSEIRDLMGLLRRFIRNDLAELHGNNVKVRVIGERAPSGARCARERARRRDEAHPFPQDAGGREQPEADEPRPAEISGRDGERRQHDRGGDAQPQVTAGPRHRCRRAARQGRSLGHDAQDPASATRPPNRRSRRRYSASAFSSAVRSKSGQ